MVTTCILCEGNAKGLGTSARITGILLKPLCSDCKRKCHTDPDRVIAYYPHLFDRNQAVSTNRLVKGPSIPKPTAHPISGQQSQTAPEMTTTHCQNCGTQLQDANIRFCSSCGSQVARPNPQGNVSKETSDVSVVKAKLQPPAIAIIVNAGIGLVLSLYVLMLPKHAYYRSEEIANAVGNTLMILSFPALAFSIYSALQMMNARKHGFAMASAIITILSGFFLLIGFPIGIWALIVLLKPEIKSAFADKSKATP